jgi:hypothetical protein
MSVVVLRLIVGVRTQFSKDDVEASDSSVAGLLTMILTVMMEFWVDLTAK